MNTDNRFVEANKLWDENKLEEAFSLFYAAALDGDLYSKNTLGYFFDHGIGVKKNTREAVSWYRKGAMGGDLCAFSNLALAYLSAGNIRRAKFWLVRALNRGDVDAALELAKLYLRNDSKSNRARAKQYLCLVAESTNIGADEKKEAQQLLVDLQPKGSE